MRDFLLLGTKIVFFFAKIYLEKILDSHFDRFFSKTRQKLYYLARF